MATKNTTKKYILFLLVWFITLIPSLYYISLQVDENRVIDQFLRKNNFINMPISKTTAYKVSDIIRGEFNTDESKFVHLNMANRPFLRNDTAFLLKYKEGLCGEGARVIINLLQRIGFDATRITLFNKHLQAAHTLVSVKIGDREFLVDSINSDRKVNLFLRNNDISPSDFNLMHYSSNILTRRLFVNKKHKEHAAEVFFDHYWLYSYEALPYTKLVTKLGMDVRVFNFDRPPLFISSMAEKPNTIMAILMFILSSVTMLIVIGIFNLIEKHIKTHNE